MSSGEGNIIMTDRSGGSMLVQRLAQGSADYKIAWAAVNGVDLSAFDRELLVHLDLMVFGYLTQTAAQHGLESEAVDLLAVLALRVGEAA